MVVYGCTMKNMRNVLQSLSSQKINKKEKITMNIKMKCYNKELRKWDECAYPVFKGLNPLEVIGFHDENGNEQLIEDGSSVKLFTGVHDLRNDEIYDGDILKSNYNGMLFVAYLSQDGIWSVAPYDGKVIYFHDVLPNNLSNLSDELILTGKNICEAGEHIG